MAVALVTGGAKRLGASIAEYFAREGYDVAIHYNASRDEANVLAERLQADYGVRTTCIQGDLRNREDLLRVVPEAVNALGPLRVLVNNASVMRMDRVDDAKADFEVWDDNLRTNLEAPFFLTQAFAQQFKDDRQEEGVVINMIDQRVWRPTPNFGSYSLAKQGLYLMTKTAAQALAPKIRVNGIGPGTTLIGAHQSDENFAYHRKISVLERGADVSDILQAVDYLLKARNVTGQMIAVDGGQHLIWKLPEA